MGMGDSMMDRITVAIAPASHDQPCNLPTPMDAPIIKTIPVSTT